MNGSLASVYFASDQVICAVAHHEGLKIGAQFERIRHKPSNQPGRVPKAHHADIRLAVRQIGELLEGETLDGVMLICPGPLRSIDRHSKHYGKVGRNCEAAHWRDDTNIIDLFRNEMGTKYANSITENTVIRMYGKAGATSIGDYLGRHADSIRERVKNEEFERDIYKDIGNYLHITADSSIRAALVVEGEPFHGEAAMEVGHHAVLPAKIDQEHRDRLSCPAHPQRPCLNSLASLPAIKRRWKELENTAFKDIKDTEKVSLVSWYISQMVSNVILSTSPAKVVVGGRIADNQKFLELLRKHVFYLLMDREYPGEVYPGYTELQDMEDFISWQTDKDAGVKGGIYLLFRLLLKERKIVDLNKAKQVWPL